MNMFDAHAHVGKYTDQALINTSRPDDYEKAMSFPFRSAGLLPEYSDNDIIAFEEYLDKGFNAGEIGIDRRYPDKERQIELFRKVLRIAADREKLITIHAVGYTDVLIKELKAVHPKRFIVHGFTGSYETASEITKLGGFISLGPKSVRIRDFRKIIGLPFLIESDMKTGEEQEEAVRGLSEMLSNYTGLDTESRNDSYIKELLNV